ncbi:MAG: hypothetical protein ACFFFB_01725 [Candidatus Heimdallarchaeota archaeon]
MLKRRQDEETNYILLKTTSPDGKNLLEKEGCKKILSELSSYINSNGGEYYTEESIIILKRRELVDLRGIGVRYIRIPKKLSGRINPYFKHDVVLFETPEVYELEKPL